MLALVIQALALSFPSGPSLQDGWIASEGAGLRGTPTAFQEGADQLVLEEEGTLVRLVGRARERIPIGCTLAGGPGRIHEMARDPSGMTWVAADEGLFVLASESEALDRLVRVEGAPPGKPRSVYVDERRRLWVGTDEAFGVVEPSFGWGRTIEGGARRGPYRLAKVPGGFLVATPAGLRRYEPDAGPEPRMKRFELVGKEPPPKGPIELAYGESPELVVEGEAPGGATYRYRVDEHHVWHPVEEGQRLPELSPGKHSIDVVAIDRDLNASEPQRVNVRVAYPFYYDKSFVLVVGVALLVASYAGFFWAARRRGIARAWWRASLSSALFLVLTGQVLAGLFPHARGWPFIGFKMYSQPFLEGDPIYNTRMMAQDERGEWKPIGVRSLGNPRDDDWQIMRPLIDGGEPTLRQYLADYNERYNRDFVGIQVQVARRRLLPEGPVVVAPLVLAMFSEKPFDDGR